MAGAIEALVKKERLSANLTIIFSGNMVCRFELRMFLLTIIVNVTWLLE